MRYCAFLRGVNVGGNNMKMAEVVKVFENAGMQNVAAVLATGNLIFSSELNVENIKAILEKEMSKYFDYESFMFLKTQQEIAKIFENCPFEKSDNQHIYIFVTTKETEKILLSEFEKGKKSEGEKAIIIDGIFYWQINKGNTLDSDFGKILGKKALKSEITSRNINTFEKILKKL